MKLIIMCLFCAMYHQIWIYPVEIGVQISWNKKPMKRLCWFDMTLSSWLTVQEMVSFIGIVRCLGFISQMAYAPNVIPLKIGVAFACEIMIQWGDNFAHDTAANLSPYEIITIKIRGRVFSQYLNYEPKKHLWTGLPACVWAYIYNWGYCS